MSGEVLATAVVSVVWPWLPCWGCGVDTGTITSRVGDCIVCVLLAELPLQEDVSSEFVSVTVAFDLIMSARNLLVSDVRISPNACELDVGEEVGGLPSDWVGVIS